jgi:hypothetical protein
VLREYQTERLNAFLRWVRETVHARRYLLNASVFSLGFGVGLLPVAYVPADHEPWIWTAGALATLAALVLPAIIDGVQRNRECREMTVASRGSIEDLAAGHQSS